MYAPDMTEIGFPSAHHEATIELTAPNLHTLVAKALAELGWNSAENSDDEFQQFFRPDHTWWKNRWKTGVVKVLSDRVLVRVEKYALGDIVDWNDECAKSVEAFRAKLLEVAARGGYRQA